jgi:hypothetical protein
VSLLGKSGSFCAKLLIGLISLVMLSAPLRAQPVIVNHPEGQAASAGTDTTLAVSAEGTPPLGYQWTFNGGYLVGATNSNLTLTNVQLFQAGDYQVIVTNSAGVMTSEVATLSVSWRPDFLWAQQAGGTNNNDLAWSVAVDPAGNVYVTGGFSDTATFGTNTLVAAGNPGADDIFLAKYSRAGELAWMRQVGNTRTDVGMGVAADRDGNIFMTGLFTSNVWFDAILVTNRAPTSAYWDMFIAKYDGDGNVIWARNAGGGNNYDEVKSINLHTNGDPIITGYFTGTGYFGTAIFGASGKEEYFTAQYSRDSGSIVRSSFGSSQGGTPSNAGYDFGQAIAVDGAGRQYVGGHFSGTNFNFFNGFNINIPYQTYAPFVARYSPSGNMEWAQLQTNVYFIQDMTGAGTNGFYICGNNFALARVDAAGSTVWNTGAGGDAANAAARSITKDRQGNLWLTGNFYGTNLIFPGITLTNGPTTNQGVVACYDSAGNFQWARQFGGRGEARRIAVDATDSAYVVGWFEGEASFGSNTLTSAGGRDIFVARLGVLPPVIRELPESRTIFTGMDSVFHATVSGDAPLRYQWRFNGNEILGATNRSLSLVDIQLTNAGAYSYVVSNSFGVAISPDAILDVITGAPAILIHPQSQVATGGTTRVFSVLATNSLPLAYQWQHFDINLPGATAANLILTNLAAADRGDYRVEITNAYGSVTSDIATLTVNLPARIFLSPTNQVVPSGSDVTFHVVATGDDVLTYQWRRAGVAMSGETNAFLTLPNVQLSDQGSYSVVVSNLYGSATSSSASLVVNAPPSITTQPVSLAVPAGTNVTLAVTSSGSPTLRYQWRFNGAPLGGKTQPTLSLLNLQSSNAGSYDVVVTNGFGAVTSNPAILSVNPSAPFIVTHPASITTDLGAAEVNFMVQAVGSAPISYQWHFQGSAIPNANSGMLSITNLQYTNLGAYFATASNAFGSATSLTAFVRIEQPPEVLWTAKLGGAGNDHGLGVAVDTMGNVYTAGSFSGTMAFGSSNLVSSGSTDIFLAKYTATGQPVWVRRMGGNLPDGPASLKVDPSGDLWLAGYYQSAQISFDTNQLNNPNNNTLDAFIAKYDADGTALWAKRLGGVLSDQALAVAVDNTGQAYVTGSYYSWGLFGGIGLTNLNHTNFFVAKFDAAGNALWARTATGTNTCQGTGVAVDAQQNVYVTGHLSGSANFGGGALINTNGTFSFGNRTVFVAKYDADGTLQWSRIGGTNGLGFGQSIVADTIGNIYATSYRVSYGGGVMLSKYDDDGNLLWVRTNAVSCCTGDYISVNGLALDAGGNPLLAGGMTGSGPIEGLYLSSPQQGFVVKYRADTGTPFWILKSGQMGSAAVVDSFGNAYLAGRFSGVTLFGTSSNLVSSGGTDAFLVKFGVRPPGLTLASTTLLAAAGTNVTLQAPGVTGTPPFSYQWQLNGTNLAGATNSSLTLSNFQSSGAGRYSLVVQSPVGGTTGLVAGVALLPELQIAFSDQAAVLDWAGTFTLQAAPAATGPFVDVMTGGGAFTNSFTLGEMERYFRLRVPSPHMSGMLQTDGFALNFVGSPGRRYAIEISTNLLHWVALTTNVFPFTWQDSAAAVSPRKFYRARLIP